MISSNLISLLVVTGASAGVVKRGGTCSFELVTQRTQNPVGGGDNTIVCAATLDYGDGRKEKLSDNCYDIAHDKCYNSQLPFRICIHTNPALRDGYLDYGAEHRDFNEDGCKRGGWANPGGDADIMTCTFPC